LRDALGLYADGHANRVHFGFDLVAAVFDDASRHFTGFTQDLGFELGGFGAEQLTLFSGNLLHALQLFFVLAQQLTGFFLELAGGGFGALGPLFT
jgi:hypothetical protein